MSLVAGHPVGYQSTGSSEQGVGSRRGQRGRLGEEEVGFRERRTGKRRKGRRNRRERRREKPTTEGAQEGSCFGAHLHPWDGWRVGPGRPAAPRFPSRRGQRGEKGPRVLREGRAHRCLSLPPAPTQEAAPITHSPLWEAGAQPLSFNLWKRPAPQGALCPTASPTASVHGTETFTTA